MDAATSRQPTVLVIEDDPGIRDLLVSFLRLCGYQVFAASLGSEGLALASQIRPGTITLDLCFPDMSGLDILRALKAKRATRRIPVIVVSGSTDLMSPADRQSAFRVIRKPFELAEIETTLASASRTQEHLCLSLPKVS